MDRVSQKVRSKIMAAVRSRGGTAEHRMEVLLRANKLSGFRKQWPVAGRPDFAWPSTRVALFIDGCFWHGCPCKRPPKSNADFWKAKVLSNRRRDARVARKLRKEGWTVLRVWGCAVNAERTIARIIRTVREPRRPR